MGQPAHVAHRLLTEDPTVDAVVLAVSPDRVLAGGLGVARADVVALVDDETRSDPRVRDVVARTGAEVLHGHDPAAILELLSCA